MKWWDLPVFGFLIRFVFLFAAIAKWILVCCGLVDSIRQEEYRIIICIVKLFFDTIVFNMEGLLFRIANSHLKSIATGIIDVMIIKLRPAGQCPFEKVKKLLLVV